MLDPHRVDRLCPEADAARVHAIDDDAPRVGRPERGAKAFGRALRVEAAEALEAFAHRRDAQREELVEIGFGDGHEAKRCAHGATV